MKLHVTMDPTLRLDRRKLYQRISMENEMEVACWQWINFVCLLVSFICCMGSYDPIDQVSNIHNNIRQRFNTPQAKKCASHADILAYIESFLNTAYDMAPALVDANTLNSIDYARCTDHEVSDICRLTYWYENPRIGQVNRAQVLRDVHSTENIESVIDCPSTALGNNCFNRAQQVDDSLTQKTLGLTPEDPVILQSRLDYPIPSIVPLTPILWQTRGKRTPCSGFGDRYNGAVLGAGRCSVDTTCNPKSVTAFSGTKPAKSTNREQSFFVTYSEDVFFCVDRETLADKFFDKSWTPWANYEDLTKGREADAVLFNGVKVFYKFLPDIAYIQSPIPNSVRIPDTADQACPGGVPLQFPLPRGVGSDPLLNESHALWKEEQHNDVFNSQCALRKLWADAFYQMPSSDRANSFLTLETTELTLSVLVLTPQGEKYADVQTLVRVVWKVDQGGTISAEEIIQSTSQTAVVWYVWVGIVVLLGTLEMCQGIRAVFGVYRRRKHARKTGIQVTESVKIIQEREFFNGLLDIVTSISAIGVVISNLILELLPPDVTGDLLSSFEANNQDTYFKVFQDIVMYNENLYILKKSGFVVVCLQFFRFVLYLCLHPRMAVLVNTLNHLGSNLYHFALYFLFINTILVYLGWWMFAGEDNVNYGTFMKVVYTQFRMLTGDFPFPDEVPSISLGIYLIIYTFMVFIILVNFLLAIVVGAYDGVMEEMSDTDQNVHIDVLDVGVTWYKRRRFKYPSANFVLSALDRDVSESVDAQMLYEDMANGDIEEGFESTAHAQQYLEFYANKLTDRMGNSILAYSVTEDTAKAEVQDSEYQELTKKMDDIIQVVQNMQKQQEILTQLVTDRYCTDCVVTV